MVKRNLFILFLISTFLLQGCLVVARRIFTYTIKKDGSVELVINYLDIRSAYTTNGLEPDTGFVEKDEEPALSEEIKDYNTLVQEFYVSDYFAQCYKSGKVISRKLYKENGLLNGEVKVRFESIEKAGLSIQKKNFVLRSDSLCGYVHYIDSVAVPFNPKMANDTSAQYYLFTWPKKSKSFTVELVPYFPYKNSVSLIEQWEKDK